MKKKIRLLIERYYRNNKGGIVVSPEYLESIVDGFTKGVKKIIKSELKKGKTIFHHYENEQKTQIENFVNCTPELQHCVGYITTNLENETVIISAENKDEFVNRVKLIPNLAHIYRITIENYGFYSYKITHKKGVTYSEYYPIAYAVEQCCKLNEIGPNDVYKVEKL